MRARLDELRALPPADRGIALRAASRGPVPDDPAVRQTALRLASHALTRSTNQRPLAVACCGLMAPSRPRCRSRPRGTGWVSHLFLGLLALVFVQPPRLARRVALLADQRSPR